MGKNLTALRLKRGAKKKKKSHFTLQLPSLWELGHQGLHRNRQRIGGEGQNGELEFGPTVILCSFQKKMSPSDQTNQHWRYSFFFPILFQLQLNPGLSSCLLSPFDITQHWDQLKKATLRCCAALPPNSGKDTEKKSRRQNEIQVQRSATVASAKLRLKVFFKRHQCVFGVCQRRLQTATRPNLMAPV